MNKSARILVINPNSNEQVTKGFAGGLTGFQLENGPEIHCATLAAGPFGIQTQADAESVVMPLRDLVASDSRADAFVIACFSDPGLHVCREATPRPVFGIAECGVLTALAHADRFGIIAIAQRSIPRHSRYLRQMGLTERFAGEVALNMTVAEAAGDGPVLERLIETGQILRDRDGASAIVMGCAGFARHRSALEDALQIPVIDPVQAAVGMAVGALLSKA